MKNVTRTFCLFLFCGFNLSGQTIWLETFEETGVGVGGACTGSAHTTCVLNSPPSNGQWHCTGDASGLADSDDYFKVVTVSGEQLMEAQDLAGNEFCLVSEAIDLSGYTYSDLSIELSEVGTMESSDQIHVEISIDDGPADTIAFLSDDFTSFTVQHNGITGNSMVIRICAINSASGEKHRIDNMVVSSGLLPVELTSFTGTATDGGHELTWQTSSETDHERFVVEHRSEATPFEDIHQVAGKGNASEGHRYQYLFSAPQRGVNYYRLRQVGLDGGIEFSSVISVENRNHEEIRVYPFAAEAVIHIQLSAQNASPFKATVMDHTGRVYDRFFIEPGINHKAVNVSGLTPGTYFLRLTGSRAVKTFRFQKK